MTQTKRDPRTLTLGLALVLSWLGMILYNALDLPKLTLLSPAELYRTLVYVILFSAYLFLPFKRLVLVLILVGAVLQLVAGSMTVTPRAFAPFSDYLAQEIYSGAQIPLIILVWHQLRAGQS